MVHTRSSKKTGKGRGRREECKRRGAVTTRGFLNPLFVILLSVSWCCCAEAVECAANAVNVGDTTNCSCSYGYTGNGAVLCTACVPGKTKGDIGPATCVSCPPGTFSLAAQASCTSCRGGSIAAASGSSSCTNCTAGQFSPLEGTVCTNCPAGTYTSKPLGVSDACTDCQGGTASTVVAATSNATCQSCSAGAFAPVRGTRCEDCVAGTYSKFRSAACTTCQTGKFSTATGTVTGTIQIGGNFVTRVAANGDQVCADCLRGFFASVAGSSACTACVGGKYSQFESATICLNCKPGKASSQTGASANNETVCQPCGVGTWSTQGFSICTACTPGKYSNLTGSFDPDNCLECLPGQFSRAGQAQCTLCHRGTYSGVAASVCTNCSAGTASEAEGLEANSPTVCIDCEPGNFSRPGSTYCLRCNPGKYSKVVRSPECEWCEEGFHNPFVSATDCIECPINSFCNETGLTLFYPCPQDLFSRAQSKAITDCRVATIEVSPSDLNWGEILQAAPNFANIFMRAGSYSGYCNLKVNAVKIEGVEGKEKTIIDCEGKQRHFSIDQTKNITVIGLTLKNGYAEDDSGGCIKLTRGVLTLVESSLVNCRAGTDGGAIHVSIRSLIDIRRADFIGCHSSENGGCITIKNSTIRLNEANFLGGQAAQIGGAIYLEDISDLEATRSSIIGCSALGGGAMAFEGVKIAAQVSFVRFTNNAATNYEDGMYSGGGAILVLRNSEITVKNCLFADNAANYSGGALRIDTVSKMTTESNEFQRNTARLYGGCVRVGLGSSFEGQNNLFDNNWGYKGGGVIAYSSASGGGALRNSRFMFDPQKAYLGGPESTTQNFAVCLQGQEDSQPDRLQALLQQPCMKEFCEESMCWGVLQVVL